MRSEYKNFYIAYKDFLKHIEQLHKSSGNSTNLHQQQAAVENTPLIVDTQHGSLNQQPEDVVDFFYRSLHEDVTRLNAFCVDQLTGFENGYAVLEDKVNVLGEWHFW